MHHFLESLIPTYLSRFRIGPNDSPAKTNEMVREESEEKYGSTSV